MEIIQADSNLYIDDELIKCPFCNTGLKILKIEGGVAFLELAKTRAVRSKRKK